MSDYTQLTTFATKDALVTGNPLKIVRGAEIDPELIAIATAIATKLDSSDRANPTATIGLAAVNGVAATYMSSDSAPALSQAISPTWSGTHTFSLAARFADGLVGTPGITFASDLDTGIFRSGTNALDITTAGVNHVNIRDNAGAPFTDISKGVLRVPDGTAPAPTFTFWNDTDTGLHHAGTNRIDIDTAGASHLAINDNAGVPAIDVQKGVFRVLDGVVGTPSLAFSGDTNSGLYRAGSDDVAVAAGGTDVVHFTSNAGATPQIRPADGVVGNPIYSFNADPDTGFFREFSGATGYSSNGTQVASLRPSANGSLFIAEPAAGTLVLAGYRAIPRSTTATTLSINDVGKCVAISAAINIPISVFAAGDAVTIYNDSAGALNLTISAGTLRLAGSASTGTRSIAARGFCTVWFNSGGATPEVIASGNVT